MSDLELLTADQRDLLRAMVPNVEPISGAILLKQARSAKAGLRTVARIVALEDEIERLRAELDDDEPDHPPRDITIVDAGGERAVHAGMHSEVAAISAAQAFWQDEVDHAAPALDAIKRGEAVVTWLHGDEVVPGPTGCGTC
jgi:hypothetical protein